MNTTSPDRIAAWLFGGASLLMCLLIIIYFVVYQPPGGDWAERLNYMNERWKLISLIWQAEFLTVLLISWASFRLAKLNSGWYLLAIGHVLMLSEYALMLGGYRQVTSEEFFNLVDGLAQWVFVASNFIWLTGMVGIYLSESGWIRYVGAALSALCALLAFLLLTEMAGSGLMVAVGPLIILLFLLNAYYGFRILARKTWRMSPAG